MEKISSFDRVVGKIPKSEKEEILRDRGERFDDQVFEDLKGKERKKTPEELRMIFLANEATNEIRRKYGLADFNIPQDNIHVITEDAWPEEDNTAFFNSMLQGVAMREKISNIAFMKTVFHEMLHFKSHNAGQITVGEDPELAEYRLGLTVHTRDGKKMYFENLNEAVTEEMTKRFMRKVLGNTLFASEIEQTKDVMRKNPEAVTSSGEALFDEDTFYAGVRDDKSWKGSADRLFGRLFGSNAEISVEHFTYQTERRILSNLIDKIFERNYGKFHDREEIFEIFAKGMMTGNILPVGRLIERTFGKGTLRRIGELDQNMQAQEVFIRAL